MTLQRRPMTAPTPLLRPAELADAEACGRITYAAFRRINESRGFPPDFPSVEAATRLARAMIADPAVFGIVAASGGGVVGSNFLTEGDPIRGVEPITVDPEHQGGGVGRRLMQAVIERGASGRGVRLVQGAFNTVSLSLYASLGFEAREPLVGHGRTPRPCLRDGRHRRCDAVRRLGRGRRAVPARDGVLPPRRSRRRHGGCAPAFRLARGLHDRTGLLDRQPCRRRHGSGPQVAHPGRWR